MLKKVQSKTSGDFTTEGGVKGALYLGHTYYFWSDKIKGFHGRVVHISSKRVLIERIDDLVQFPFTPSMVLKGWGVYEDYRQYSAWKTVDSIKSDLYVHLNRFFDDPHLYSGLTPSQCSAISDILINSSKTHGTNFHPTIQALAELKEKVGKHICSTI